MGVSSFSTVSLCKQFLLSSKLQSTTLSIPPSFPHISATLGGFTAEKTVTVIVPVSIRVKSRWSLGSTGGFGFDPGRSMKAGPLPIRFLGSRSEMELEIGAYEKAYERRPMALPKVNRSISRMGRVPSKPMSQGDASWILPPKVSVRCHRGN